MQENPTGKKALRWKSRYKEFVLQIRDIYPKACIILSTSIMNHHDSWDNAIATICQELKDPKILHYVYARNGKATPGHLRISEAEEMADELQQYIEHLDIPIWE